MHSCVSVDVAIGAPFAGPDQRGKVLIYNGNRQGLNTKASQILQGMWASQAMPSGFGFTLRGDSDIDKNDYPGKVSFFSLKRVHFLEGAHSLGNTSCASSSQTGEGCSPAAQGLCRGSGVTFMRI